MTPSMSTQFEAEKAALLRFVQTLEKAESPQELRGLLMADLTAPYHSYDTLALLTKVENLTYDLVDLMSNDLDEDGGPV